MKSLNYEKTKKLLSDYKIPVCEGELVESKKQALKIVKKIGYPIAFKISSEKVLHKTDIGGVRLNIQNKKELNSAWRSISEIKVEKKGILVQKMVFGNQVILGMKRDKQFGAVLMFGLGGVFVEVLKDVTFRIAPVSRVEALGMIKEIKGYKILKGFRGQKASNIKKIVDIVVLLSDLSLSREDIKEIDFNPIIVNEKQALVVDARFLIEE